MALTAQELEHLAAQVVAGLWQRLEVALGAGAGAAEPRTHKRHEPEPVNTEATQANAEASQDPSQASPANAEASQDPSQAPAANTEASHGNEGATPARDAAPAQASPTVRARALQLELGSDIRDVVLRALRVWLLQLGAQQGRTALSITLTLAGPDPAVATLLKAARAWAREVATEDDCGAWLVLDRSPSSRAHLHGAVLTRADINRLIAAWCSRTGAEPAAQRAHSLVWDRELDQRLEAVVDYAIVGATAADEDVEAAQVAAGSFVALRRAVVRTLERAREAATRRAARPERICARRGCGRVLPAELRVDAVHCSASCRKAAARNASRGGGR